MTAPEEPRVAALRFFSYFRKLPFPKIKISLFYFPPIWRIIGMIL